MKALFILLPIFALAQIHNFQWPLAPVHEQHRISATLDECREERDHFHNGTDMPLAPGGEVLSIMAGQVLAIDVDWIRVEDFAYVHVDPNPALHVGNAVAQGAVLGWTDSYAHIHLNYGGGESGHPTGNPLLPNGVAPFNDPYHPRSPIIKFGVDASNTEFPGNVVSGRFDIIAEAADTTDLLSSIDMNNGIYTIGYALYSSDTSVTLIAPTFWFEADEYYSSSYINYVYAPGSNTSVYRYRVTNRVTSNGYIDADLYTPGPYVVAVFSSDTQDNWDTTYVPVVFSDIDLLPPGRPELRFVGASEAGGLLLEWEAVTDPDLAGYILEFSFNGVSWSSNHGPSVLTPEMTSFTVQNFPQNAYVQFRMKAVDTAAIPNASDYSDTYGIRLANTGTSILIVDGFDRTDGSWTENQHDFATYYADAIVNSGTNAAVSVASNEWAAAQSDLSRFGTLIWFVGDDSRTAETFSTAEQIVITNFINGGGDFMASGAEIGYDLSAGSAADIAFMTQVLHLNFAGDNSGSTVVTGVAPHFSGIDLVYGASPYIEDWPDYFTPANGGEAVLDYGNGLHAAIGFRGESTASFVMGFSFETIDTEDHRGMLMGRILEFFESTVSVDEGHIPLTYSISAAYPNPFNAAVTIAYQLPQPGDINIMIYDLRGRRVYTDAFSMQAAGRHLWHWQGQNDQGLALASGSYLFQLYQHGHETLTQKLILLK